MKNLKKFNQFITESRENSDGNTLDDLYQMGSEEISRAASFIVYGDDWDNKDPEKAKRWDNLNSMDPSEIIPELKKAIEIETDPKVKKELESAITSIEDIDNEISNFNSGYDGDDDEWDEDDEHNPNNFDDYEDDDW